MPVRPGTHKPRLPDTGRHQPPGATRWGRGRGGSKWRTRRQRIFERDKYLCQICLADGQLTPVELHGPRHGVCDHRIPTAEGGTDHDSNLQTICQDCDRTKTGQESRRAGGGPKVQGLSL